MIIVGAKGHALEIYDELLDKSEILFYDDVNSHEQNEIFGNPIISSLEGLAIQTHFFILGLGGVTNRKKVFDFFTAKGFKSKSIISNSAKVSSSSKLGDALNIMALSFIGPNTSIGLGSLVNTLSAVHHDSKIGEFVEIGPGAKILGNVTIGDNSFIGSNATILPNLHIGSNVVVGAGAVVTKNIANNKRVKGIPAITF